MVSHEATNNWDDCTCTGHSNNRNAIAIPNWLKQLGLCLTPGQSAQPNMHTSNYTIPLQQLRLCLTTDYSIQPVPNLLVCFISLQRADLHLTTQNRHIDRIPKDDHPGVPHEVTLLVRHSHDERHERFGVDELADLVDLAMCRHRSVSVAPGRRLEQWQDVDDGDPPDFDAVDHDRNLSAFPEVVA
jgi:hypothetical protein